MPSVLNQIYFVMTCTRLNPPNISQKVFSQLLAGMLVNVLVKYDRISSFQGHTFIMIEIVTIYLLRKIINTVKHCYIVYSVAGFVYLGMDCRW